MSMQGGMGAARAAEEIADAIRKEIDEAHPLEEEAATNALERILKLCKEIADAGNTGWY